MKRVLFFLLAISCLSCDKESNQEIDKSGWEEDLEFLKSELPKVHKDLFFSLSKEEFDSGIESIKLELDSLTDFEIVFRLQQLIAKIGDTHTGISINEKYIDTKKSLPFTFYWFKDGIYITSSADNYIHLIGKRILSINGFDINEIVDSVSTLITIDNEACIKNTVPNILIFPEVYKFFDFTNNNTLNLKLENISGNVEDHTIDISLSYGNVTKQMNNDSLAFTFQWVNEGVIFQEEYFDNQQIYFLQYNQCTSKEIQEARGNHSAAEKLPSFNEFESRVFETIENKPITKFIFDMRFNSGGSSMQGTKFVAKLSEYSKLNNKGKIYVLIGRKTFSSAIINTLDFTSKTDAILVGESTSGKPNAYGEVKNLYLPNSNVRIYYSTKYFKLHDEDLNTIEPDIYIETSFSEFQAGIDPVFDMVVGF
jgi:hypothetical protein